jgi:hypothetical protein
VLTSSLIATSSRVPALELSSDPGVGALGVLAEDHEVDVGGAPVPQRNEAIAQSSHRPHVRVEVETEPQPEQDVAGVLDSGHARIAERAEQHGRGIARDAIAHVGRIGDPIAKIPLGAEVERPDLDRESALGAVKLEHARRLRDHLGTDPVASDDRDECGGPRHSVVVGLGPLR